MPSAPLPTLNAGLPKVLCRPTTGPNHIVVTLNPNGLDCFNRLNSNTSFDGVCDQPTGESFYNALNITLNKNVSKGLQFQAAYT